MGKFIFGGWISIAFLVMDLLGLLSRLFKAIRRNTGYNTNQLPYNRKENDDYNRGTRKDYTDSRF
jgi:hypothetical protein